MKRKTTVPPMSEAARQARNAYYRQLRARDPEKAKARTIKYWEKKAAELATQEQNGGTQHD